MDLRLQKIQALLADDLIPEALAELRIVLENGPLFEEVLQQSARHSEISRQLRLGHLSFQEAATTTAQIRAGLFEVLHKIQKQAGFAPLGQENPGNQNLAGSIYELERIGFEQQFRLAAQKLQRLETAHLLETDEARKFAYEQEIEKLKVLNAELKAKLNL